MPKAQAWALVAVAGILVLGLVGWIAFNRPSDGSTRVENPPPPDATSIAQPVPGQEATPAAGVTVAPQVDAQGAAVIR
jgi:hypothetical protein